MVTNFLSFILYIFQVAFSNRLFILSLAFITLIIVWSLFRKMGGMA